METAATSVEQPSPTTEKTVANVEENLAVDLRANVPDDSEDIALDGEIGLHENVQVPKKRLQQKKKDEKKNHQKILDL